LLALALMIFALSRPYFAAKAKPSKLQIAIIDTSASMQATDESPSRFEAAKREALKLVNGLGDNDRMMVVKAASHTSVVCSPTSEKEKIRRAINELTVEDTTSDISQAVKLALAFSGVTSAEGAAPVVADTDVHLFSDGAVPEPEALKSASLRLHYLKLGKSAHNVGITALDVRTSASDASRSEIYISIANFFDREITADLQVLLDDQLLDVRPVTLAATNETQQLITAAVARDGILTARLKVDDDLAVDNVAYVVNRTPQPVKVLLVTRGNSFLERALAIGSNVQVTKITPDQFKPTLDYDVVVCDFQSITELPRGNCMFIHSYATKVFEIVGQLEWPMTEIIDCKSNHDLMRHVQLDEYVAIAKALQVKPPDWAQVVVESRQGPLILAGEQNHQRIVFITFDLLDSRWPLRISFPIFIANAIQWLNPHRPDAALFQVKAGEPIRLPLKETVTNIKVTRPDKSVESVVVEEKARELVYKHTDAVGVYEAKVDDQKIQFCSNLLSKDESNIAPREQIAVGKFGAVESQRLLTANMEIWRWIALGGFCLLCVEWYLFHRRVL
jgi:Mg-chelatase subunit ChlD